MKNYKLYIFDLDGTTVDSTESFRKCYKTAFEACGVAFDDSINIDLITLDLGSAYAQIKDKAPNCERKFYEAFVSGISPTFVKYAKFYSDVEKVFKHLKANGAIVGIFTNRESNDIKAILDINSEIKGNLDFFIGRDMLKNPKPAPEGILTALEKYGFDKKDTIYVGDAPGDYESAKEAGIDFYYIDRYNIKELSLEQHLTLEDLIK